MMLLVALQCVWSISAGVLVALMWRWRREGERNLEHARKLHAECARAVAAATRAGVDLDAYLHDA